MNVEKFKNQLFLFLIIAKFVTIIILLFHADKGGFSTSQTWLTITLIIPLFTTYTSAMFKERLSNFIKQKDEATEGADITRAAKKDNKNIGKTYLLATYIIFFTYFIAILYVLILKIKGVLPFESMGTALGCVESGFGIYIGIMVSDLFSQDGTN